MNPVSQFRSLSPSAFRRFVEASENSYKLEIGKTSNAP
jgi:hypothetical protein